MKIKILLIIVFMILFSSTASAWWNPECPVYRKVTFSELNDTSLNYSVGAYTVRLDTTGKYNTTSCDYIHLINTTDSEIPFDCNTVSGDSLTHDITFTINESNIGGVTNQVFGYIYYNCSTSVSPASFDETNFWVNGDGGDGNITFFTNYISGMINNQSGGFVSLNGSVAEKNYALQNTEGFNRLTGNFDYFGYPVLPQYIKCSVPDELNGSITKGVECISNKTGNMTQNFTFYRNSPCYKTDWMTGGTNTILKYTLDTATSNYTTSWFNGSSNVTVHITTDNGTFNSDVWNLTWFNIYNFTNDEVVVTWFNQTHEDFFNIDHRFVGGSNIQLFRNNSNWDMKNNITTWQCIIPEESNDHAVMDSWGAKLTSRMLHPLEFSLGAETGKPTSLNYCTTGNATHYVGINLSFWEEKIPTTTVTDSYIEVDLYYYSTSSNDYEHYYFSKDGIHQAKICFSKTITISELNATILFRGNTSTALRQFYLMNESFSENIIEMKLYNILVGDSAGIIIYVQDEVTEPVTDVYIEVYKYVVGSGTYNRVAMGLTDADGRAYIYLEPFDAFYQFRVLDPNGNLLKTFPLSNIMSDEVYLLYGDVPFADTLDILDGVSYIFTNSSTKILLNFTDPTGSITAGCLRVIRRTAENETWLCDLCNETTNGSLECDVGIVSGKLFATFYLKINPYDSRATRIFDWYPIKTLSELVGLDGVYATILIAGTLAFSSLGGSLVLPIVFALVGLGMSMVMGFFYLGLSSFITIIIIGIIIILRGSRSGQM